MEVRCNKTLLGFLPILLGTIFIITSIGCATNKAAQTEHHEESKSFIRDEHKHQDVSQYIKAVREKVMSNWKEPKFWHYRDLVTVNFILLPSGEVEEIKFVKKSDDTRLDDLAIKAIKESAPFPSFHGESKHQHLNITLHFHHIR
ncbi:MAG: energy transducer TonB [Nitrospinales bacterium]